VTESSPPKSVRTVADALETQVATNGDETFLYYGDKQISYADLDEKANTIANGLLSQGVQPGDHVCLLLYSSLEYVYTYFALAKIGAVVVPVDTRFTDDTLAYVLSSSDAETLFLDSKTRDNYESIRHQIPQITTEYFVGDAEDDHPYREFELLLDGYSASQPEVIVSEMDTFSVTYVQRHASEEPKGVMLPQFSYVNEGWAAGKDLFEFSSDDRLFTTLPLYSIFTFQVGIMGALLSGAEFVIEDPFDPDRFWDQIERYEATIFLYLGRMLAVLYNQASESAHEGNLVEMAIGHGFGFGTDETLIRNFESQFDITVLEGYGVTQATIATYNVPDNRRLGSLGKPVSYMDVAIVDEDDRPVPTGQSGQILVRPTRPNTMMQGYYNNPEKAIEDCRNLWIHTGDIGYKDEDGYLYFVANEDNSIYQGKIAGRISSLEIESVINSQMGVRESAVVGVENEAGDEEVKAVVVTEADTDLNPVDIYRRCEEQLPYLKVPRYIDIRDELPRESSGTVPEDVLKESDLSEAWDRESGYELSR